jgi:negative regulator of flagellin synthesis FlgM
MTNRINPADQGMIGRINGKTSDKAGESGGTHGVTGDARTAGKDGREARGTDTVELTSSARLLERLEKSLAAMPELDTSRIEAVKLAIERGDYRIDAERIADAILRSERELPK